MQRRAGGGSSAPVVGGVTVGDEGAAGTIYEGFRLVDGDDFDVMPTRWSARNPTGRYSPSVLSNGFRSTNNDKSNMLYVDPAYRGARSQSPTDLGVDRVSVANSVATLSASAPDAGMLPYLPTNYTNNGRGDEEGRPKLLAGSLKAADFLLSAQADHILECKVRFPTGIPKGAFPSFWFSNFFWPDYGEIDTFEMRPQTAYGSDARINQNVIASATDGAGATFTTVNGNVAVPVDRWITFVHMRVGDTVYFYDDHVTEGTLVMVGSTTTNVTRVRGPQQVRLDMASEEETGWSAAEWPYSVDFDWWRAWAPATAASGKEPTIMLPAVNTTPGGSWAATLPPATDLSEGRAGIEQIVTVYDNIDAPGYPTRDSSGYPRPAGGMTINQATRAITGTVPTTEGGRTFLMIAYAFDDGSPARCSLLPFNVAPAVQASLFSNMSVDFGGAVDLTIAYTDFHSGNLGPHTYSVSTDAGWLTVSGNGTTEATIAGTAPEEAAEFTVTIEATNSVGQTTTAIRTIAVANPEWQPSDWTQLVAFFDPDDASTVFSDTAGTTAATADTDIAKRVAAKIGSVALTEATNAPAYVTDATIGRKCLKFTRATPTHIESSDSALVDVASGTDKGWTLVRAIRRGTPGVSVTPDSWSNSAGSDFIRNFIGGSNQYGCQRDTNAQVTAQEATGHGTTDEWDVVTFIYSGTALTIRVNGVATLTDGALNTADPLTADRFALGAVWVSSAWASSAFDGHYGPLFIADQTAFSADVAAAETWCAEWAGISL